MDDRIINFSNLTQVDTGYTLLFLFDLYTTVSLAPSTSVMEIIPRYVTLYDIELQQVVVYPTVNKTYALMYTGVGYESICTNNYLVQLGFLQPSVYSTPAGYLSFTTVNQAQPCIHIVSIINNIF